MTRFKMFTDKSILEHELVNLRCSEGWGRPEDYESGVVIRSMENYPFVVHVRDERHKLVGYLSAFGDEVYSIFIGEIIVHYESKNLGIELKLLQALEDRYSSGAIYVVPYERYKEFFIQNGFKLSRKRTTVLIKGASGRPDIMG